MVQHEVKKMTKEFLKFGVIQIEKMKFHHSKKVIDLNSIDIKENIGI